MESDGMIRNRRRRHAGLTLVEAMMALVIVGITVLSIVEALAAGHKQTDQSVRGMRGVQLCEEMLEEVLSKPYDDPDGASNLGPENGETTRASFDNADDYAGYTETAGNLKDFAGNTYGPNFQVFSRTVTITSGSQTITGLSAPVPGLTVVVTVTDDKGTQWSITRFIPEPAS